MSSGGDRRIAVVSDKLVNNLFGGKNGNAIGETLEVTVGDSFYEYTIVGVYQYEQNVYMMNFGSEKDINTNVYIPIGTAQAATHSTAGYTMATVISAQGWIPPHSQAGWSVISTPITALTGISR